MREPLTNAEVARLAQRGESWSHAQRRAERLRDCVREYHPCPHCQAVYPARPRLWGWIEVRASATFMPDMCDLCESDPRQWRDYDDQDH